MISVRYTFYVAALSCALLVGCASNVEYNQVQNDVPDSDISYEKPENTDADIEEEAEEAEEAETETDVITSSELLDSFLNGDIPATGLYEGKDVFYISDLTNVDEEWLGFEVGDRVDIDNDGEDELIMNGPYGGMILDARDGKVFMLAEGEGTAGELDIARLDDKFWIVHKDVSHGGRQIYVLDLYNGNGEIIDSTTLSAEYWDSPDDRYDMDSDFSFRDKPITMEEFERIRDELFAWKNTDMGSGNSDYIIPTSASKLLNEDDLKDLSSDELRKARNEIVARHGWIFKDSELNGYFESKSWYKGTVRPENFDIYTMLSDVERKNMDFIKNHEDGSGSGLFEKGDYTICGTRFKNDEGDGLEEPLILKMDGDRLFISGTYVYSEGIVDTPFANGRKSREQAELRLSSDIICCYSGGDEEPFYTSKDKFFRDSSFDMISLYLYVKDGIVTRAVYSP